MEYYIKKSILLPRQTLCCHVNLDDPNQNNFIVSLPDNIIDAIRKELINESDYLYCSTPYLVGPPTVGIGNGWSGDIKEEDWKLVNNKVVSIDGDFLVSTAIDYLDTEKISYIIIVSCIRGTVQF